jgi:hypothetical protein
MVQKFSHRLLQRGYPAALVASAVSAVSFSDRAKYLQRSTHTPCDSAACPLVLPYLGSVPELKLQQLLHCTYEAHPEAHVHMSKPFVCFTTL